MKIPTIENLQRKKLSMYLAVLGVIENHKAVWQPLVGIVGMVERLSDIADSIRKSSGIYGMPRDGIASGKSPKQVAIIALATEVAGDVHSLAGKSAIEISCLVNMPDTLVAARCREIHKLETDHAAALAPFGTAAADLVALEAAIQAYELVATAPREAIVIATGVTASIEPNVRAADRLLKTELDKTMRKFQRKNPDFAKAYEDAQIIMDLGGGKTALPVNPMPAPAKVAEVVK